MSKPATTIETEEQAEAVRKSLLDYERRQAEAAYAERTKRFAKATELVESDEYQKVRDRVTQLLDELGETELGVHLRPLVSIFRNFEQGLAGATRKPAILGDLEVSGAIATASVIDTAS